MLLRWVCYYLSPFALETLYCHTIWECFFMFLWELFHLLWEIISLVFCSIQYLKKAHFWRYTNADLKILLYVQVQREYTKNFAFLILRILELSTYDIFIFLKSRVLFNILFCFCKFVKKQFIYLVCA